MNTDPTLDVLAMLIAELDEVLTDEDGAPLRWWETPPHGAEDPNSDAYPFGRIGEIQVLGEERLEVVDGEEVVIDDPSEVFATLHVFSRPRDGTGGKPEAVRLAGQVRGILARAEDLELEPETGAEVAFRLVLSEIRDTRHFTDPDGLTAHSVLTARFEVEPREV